MKLKHAWDVWGEWEIRVLVLSSLALQVFLLFAGGLRKRVAEWWLRMPLWLAYLLADYVAIYALGNLSQNQKLCDGSRDAEMHVLVFWEPFLILHLGGQDTITAFAVEDNELWLRHLLRLVSQVVLAGYVYWKSRPGVRLMVPAVVMFVAGVTKYGERTLALRAASMGSLRSSMLTPPDPGPNYAKFVEECQSRRDAGLVAKIVIVPERPPDDDAHVEVKRVAYCDLVYSAHRLFHTVRRLFVDLILSFPDRIDSLAFFRKLEMEQVFKVVEIELVLMYESLHSKAPTRGYGYTSVDVDISYVLLGGAVFLETYDILLMVIYPWRYADLRASERLRPAAKAVFWLIEFFQPETRPRWSDQMSQYNLISYCLRDERRWYKELMEWLEWRWNIRVKTMWDSWRYTKKIAVSEPLKRLLKGLYKQLGWSVDCEFDESILLWHIATDLCFYANPENAGGGPERQDALPALSREISSYMLLLLVMRPFMMTASIGQMRFGDTCAEAKSFFRRADEAGCADRLRAVNTSIAEPRDVKGDRSKSVLFQACKLARQLLDLEGATEAKRWRLVASAWVEMFCYAAGKCGGSAHARQLSQGGELLTVVWLLMAHFGVGDQYRVESGHARAKLVVDT
ncbi:unnamed protein product [Miscanthus lutarioriparius]|uniref:DUF4220 domain-containing protein n=1 Tax=Miscanthus lutarioriparius TaxID=422564 RepID=A0A811Q5W1_9POAL|nr:unnamed protein product [Miscanthus lutarioriparius]